MLSRVEHLAWCKQRAVEYVDHHDLAGAVASMASDLGKHPDTAPAVQLIMIGMLEIANGEKAVRNWIDRFN